MLPLLTQLAGRSISVCARQVCPLNAVRADEQNSIVSPSAYSKRIGWTRPVWVSRAQTYKSLRPSPRLSSALQDTVRAKCAAWTDTVSLAPGPKGTRRVHGFRTGDIVRAIVPGGKRAGTHTGRVAVRTSGNFNVSATSGTVQGIGWRYCQLLHCADGYAYSFESKGGGLSSSLLSRRNTGTVKQEVSRPFFR